MFLTAFSVNAFILPCWYSYLVFPYSLLLVSTSEFHYFLYHPVTLGEVAWLFRVAVRVASIQSLSCSMYSYRLSSPTLGLPAAALCYAAAPSLRSFSDRVLILQSVTS